MGWTDSIKDSIGWVYWNGARLMGMGHCGSHSFTGSLGVRANSKAQNKGQWNSRIQECNHFLVEVSRLTRSGRGWKCEEFLPCGWRRLKGFGARVFYNLYFRKVTMEGMWTKCNGLFSFFSSSFFHRLISSIFFISYSLLIIFGVSIYLYYFQPLRRVHPNWKKSSLHRRECIKTLSSLCQKSRHTNFALHSLNIYLLLIIFNKHSWVLR